MPRRYLASAGTPINCYWWLQEEPAPVGKGWSEPVRAEDEADTTVASLAARVDPTPNTDGKAGV